MIRTIFRRVAVPVALVALLAPVAAGCGVSGGAQQAASLARLGGLSLAQAARATNEASAVTVTVTTSADDDEGNSLFAATASAAFDAGSGRSRLTVSVDDAGIGLGEGLLDVEIIIDGDAAYVRSGVLEFLADGKPWAKVESERIGDLTGDLAAQADLGATGLLDLLADVDAELRELGTEQVQGVTTRHVGADMDLGRLLEQAPGDRRDAIEDALDGIGVAGQDLGVVPVEAWIDGSGLLRRFSLRIDPDQVAPGRSFSGAGAGAVTQTFDFATSDDPVTVELPDPDEVGTFDLGDDLGGLAGD